MNSNKIYFFIKNYRFNYVLQQALCGSQQVLLRVSAMYLKFVVIVKWTFRRNAMTVTFLTMMAAQVHVLQKILLSRNGTQMMRVMERYSNVWPCTTENTEPRLELTPRVKQSCHILPVPVRAGRRVSAIQRLEQRTIPFHSAWTDPAR